MQRIAQIVYMLFVLAVIYILIRWVTTSFVITGSGPIKWEEGWKQSRCELAGICEDD